MLLQFQQAFMKFVTHLFFSKQWFPSGIIRIPAIQRLPIWVTSHPWEKSRQKKLLSHSSHFWRKNALKSLSEESPWDSIVFTSTGLSMQNKNTKRQRYTETNLYRLDWIEVFIGENNFFLLWGLVYWQLVLLPVCLVLVEKETRKYKKKHRSSPNLISTTNKIIKQKKFDFQKHT